MDSTNSYIRDREFVRLKVKWRQEMRIIYFSILALLVSSEAMAQTIHIEDLDYFVGYYSLKDTMDLESADLSRFVEWTALYPGPNYRGRDFRSLRSKKGTMMVYNWRLLTEQEGEISGGIRFIGYDRYQFYMLYSRYLSYDSTIGVLTTWEIVDIDSIKYIRGQIGEFNTGLEGQGMVEQVCVFPDTSILLVVRIEEVLTGVHKFLRGSINGDFKTFYESEQYRKYVFGGENGIIISYDFSGLDEPLFQAVEIVKFFTSVPWDEYGEYDYDFGIPRVDSADTRVLNLWDMAR